MYKSLGFKSPFDKDFWRALSNRFVVMWAVKNYYEDLSFWVPQSKKSETKSKYDAKLPVKSKLDKTYTFSDYIIRSIAKAVEKSSLPKYMKRSASIVFEQDVQEVAKTLEVFGVDLLSMVESKGVKIIREDQ